MPKRCGTRASSGGNHEPLYLWAIWLLLLLSIGHTEAKGVGAYADSAYCWDVGDPGCQDEELAVGPPDGRCALVHSLNHGQLDLFWSGTDTQDADPVLRLHMGPLQGAGSQPIHITFGFEGSGGTAVVYQTQDWEVLEVNRDQISGWPSPPIPPLRFIRTDPYQVRGIWLDAAELPNPSGTRPFEILSATFGKSAYQNGVDTAQVTVVSWSNWGNGSLTLGADLTCPTTGGSFHVGDDAFALSPGQTHTSQFSWAIPNVSYAWTFACDLTLHGNSGIVDSKHIYPAFVGNPMSPEIIAQTEEHVYDCLLDSNWDCIVHAVGLVPYLAIPANLVLLTEGSCQTAGLLYYGHWGEAFSKFFTGMLVPTAKVLANATPLPPQVLAAVNLWPGEAMAAYSCATSDFVERLMGNSKSRSLRQGLLVDSLAVWSRAQFDSSSSDILIAQGRCKVRVEADSSWADEDSVGLNLASVASLDTVGTVAWTTRHLYHFGSSEAANPHSLVSMTVQSTEDQTISLGLLHRTSTDSITFVRYPDLGVNARTRMWVIATDTSSFLPFHVDEDGDGTVDFLWYPGAAGVGDRTSTPRPGEPILSLLSVPNPSADETTIVLRGCAALKDVKVSIFDVAGRVVRRSAVGDLPAGVHQVVWDGRTDDGRRVASGIYYCMATYAGGGTSPKRLVVLR